MELIDILFGMYDGVRLGIAPLVGAAIATGVGAIGSQIIGGAQRRKQYGRQRQFNRQMADLEWKRNLEMWHKQNQYNHPSEQMKRFMDAGLNPNLIYGQGTPGNASAMPTYRRAEQPVDKEPIVNPEEAFKQALNILQSVELTKQEKEKTQQMVAQTYLEQTKKWYAETERMIDEEHSELYTHAHLSKKVSSVAKRVIDMNEARWAKKGLTSNDATWLRMTLAFAEFLGLEGTVSKIEDILNQSGKETESLNNFNFNY